MPRQQLNRALAALHRELESGAEIQAEDREALLEAVREIEDVLSQDEPGEGGPLSKRVTALIEDFETSYPKFADILRSVSESLANMGI